MDFKSPLEVGVGLPKRRLPVRGGIFGCLITLLAVAAIVACMGVIVFGITSAFRSSDVYQEALQTAQNDPDVIAALGSPVRAGWFVAGSLETSGLSGEADLRIPVRGPDGSGTLYVQARRESGVWHYYTLAVVVDGSGQTIDLR